jgi:hypothetical protein
MTGGNRTLEGLLSLAMFLTLISFGASGVLLLIIGPLVITDRLRKSDEN